LRYGKRESLYEAGLKRQATKAYPKTGNSQSMVARHTKEFVAFFGEIPGYSPLV
jgi:hypothetical protein